METIKPTFELSDEQIAQFNMAIEKIREAWEPIMQALIEVLEIARKVIMEFAEMLARWSLKAWLLELKTPYKWADYLSQKIPLWFALKFGFGWLERRLQLE